MVPRHGTPAGIVELGAGEELKAMIMVILITPRHLDLWDRGNRQPSAVNTLWNPGEPYHTKLPISLRWFLLSEIMISDKLCRYPHGESAKLFELSGWKEN